MRGYLRQRKQQFVLDEFSRTDQTTRCQERIVAPRQPSSLIRAGYQGERHGQFHVVIERPQTALTNEYKPCTNPHVQDPPPLRIA